MGATLLAAGKKGKRFALPFFFNDTPPTEIYTLSLHDALPIYMNEIVKEKRLLSEILARHTGKPIDLIEKETERDRFFSPQEAKDFCLVDEILIKIADEKKSK